MDPVAIFKQKMTAAILALPDNTPLARQGVYRKTREFITFSKYAQLGGALEAAIADLESEFGAAASAALPGIDRSARLARARAGPPWWRSSARVAAAVALALVLASVVIYRMIFASSADPGFDQGFAQYSASPQGFESIPPWSTYYTAKTEDGVTLVEAKGPVSLYSKQVFAVDPAKTYRVSTRVRVIADDPRQQGSLIAVGIVALDENGATIGRDYLAAHFPAIDNKVIAVAEGWTEGDGIISFSGTSEATLLPPGTVAVRLVALLNIRGPKAVSQIDYLRFSEAGTP